MFNRETVYTKKVQPLLVWNENKKTVNVKGQDLAKLGDVDLDEYLQESDGLEPHSLDDKQRLDVVTSVDLITMIDKMLFDLQDGKTLEERFIEDVNKMCAEHGQPKIFDLSKGRMAHAP